MKSNEMKWVRHHDNAFTVVSCFTYLLYVYILPWLVFCTVHFYTFIMDIIILALPISKLPMWTCAVKEVKRENATAHPATVEPVCHLGMHFCMSAVFSTFLIPYLLWDRWDTTLYAWGLGTDMACRHLPVRLDGCEGTVVWKQCFSLRVLVSQTNAMTIIIALFISYFHNTSVQWTPVESALSWLHYW